VDPVVAVTAAEICERPFVLLLVVLGRVAECLTVGEEPLGDREPDSRVRAGDEGDPVCHGRLLPRLGTR
jgi:hypothetical protein